MKKAKKRKTKSRMKLVTLMMDPALRKTMEAISNDASTDIATACQVLLATGMRMGRGGQDAALRDAAATILELQAKLMRCRQVMEANDPGNALDIFGEPQPSPAPAAPPEGAPTVP